MTVWATAGHVDHGKSTLVAALTGTDPDRLAEEKARGLTIDLGFAAMTLPSGRRISFVDVPGHVRFLRNMLAGVGMVDACLFVVAATEGWKPQSEEHLRILDLLGLDRGVIALSRIDEVPDTGRGPLRQSVADHLTGTFLHGAPLLGTDTRTGTGLAELRAELDRVSADVPSMPNPRPVRLWIDRSFAPVGAGTVVTGTLTGGSLRREDELIMAPQGRSVRVRGLQTAHESLDEAPPGTRVAVNLTGLTHHEIARGDVMVRRDEWHHTATIDASLHTLASLGHQVSRRGAYLAYVGSSEQPVRLRVLGSGSIRPGEVGAVRIHLPVSLPLVPGDRYVLRESGRAETVGGGEILDVDPVVPAARASPDRSVERVIAERQWVHVAELRRLTGESRPPTIGHWVVDPAALAAARHWLRDRIDAAGPVGLDVAGLDERDRALVPGLDGVEIAHGQARSGDRPQDPTNHPYLAALAASPFSPPRPDGIDPSELADLRRRGLIENEGGIWFTPDAFSAAARVMAGLLAERPAGVTMAELRDQLGCSRRFALAIIERLDRSGVTRRRGDVRIAGPRLPHPTED